MRTLRGRRLDDDILKSPIASPVGKARARDPGAQDDLHRLFKAAFRLLRRHTETLKFAVPVSLANAEIQPSAGNQIKRAACSAKRTGWCHGKTITAVPSRNVVVLIARQVSSVSVAET